MFKIHFYTAPATAPNNEPFWSRGVNDGEYCPIPHVGDSIEIFAGENKTPAFGVVKAVSFRYASHDIDIFFERG